MTVLVLPVQFYRGVIHLVRTQNFPKKQTFLTPWNNTCAYHGVRNTSFSDNFAYTLIWWYQNNWITECRSTYASSDLSCTRLRPLRIKISCFLFKRKDHLLVVRLYRWYLLRVSNVTFVIPKITAFRNLFDLGRA